MLPESQSETCTKVLLSIFTIACLLRACVSGRQGWHRALQRELLAFLHSCKSTARSGDLCILHFAYFVMFPQSILVCASLYAGYLLAFHHIPVSDLIAVTYAAMANIQSALMIAS